MSQIILSPAEATKFAQAREFREAVKWDVGSGIVRDMIRHDNPNRGYGLPQFWCGQEIIIRDPAIGHLLPGKA